MSHHKTDTPPMYDDEKNAGGAHIEEKGWGAAPYDQAYEEEVGAPDRFQEETHRSLKPRQISMIAIGGAIGECLSR